MPGLALALLGFAAGATALQWQGHLPPVGTSAIVAALLAFAALLANVVCARRGRGIGSTVDSARTFDAAGTADTAYFTGPVYTVAVAIVLRVAGVTIVALLTLAAAAATGYAYAAWRAERRLADELPARWEGVDLAVVGIIDEMPSPSASGTRFAFAVERSETPGAVVPSRLSLAWFAESKKDGSLQLPPPLAAGQRWRLVVRLKRPHGTINPQGFDLEAWLLENNLRATGYVRSDGSNRLLNVFIGRPGDWVEHAREAVRARIIAALPEARYGGVMVALAIGDQRAIPDTQWAIFNRTGISHLISISGLHVTVFAALAGALAYMLARRSQALTSRLPARKLAALVGVIAATLYVLLAGSQVPAQRTLLMLAVAALGLWLARPGTASIVWLWALAAVVAWDPWAGLTPGFWLSFGSVGLLLYANVGRLAVTVPATRHERWLAALRLGTRTQMLVTVGLVPMTLALFQQVSLISPLANALAIPTVSFIVVPLALTAIILPFDFLWQLAHAVFAVLMWPLEWLAALPAAVWQQHAPLPWAVAAALIGLGWLAAPRGVPARSLAALWFLPLWFALPPPLEPGSFRLTVLDVGQGLATVVVTRGHALVYDTGPRYSDEADAGGRIVAPYLRAAGLPRLDALIVSHQDSDHSGGARSLLQTVPVDWLASSLQPDHPLVQMRIAEQAFTLRCERGQQWDWDGVRFEILHPAAEQYADPRRKTNDRSCVLRISSDYGSALLTGDIEAKSEMELLRSDAAALRSEVLVAPHHGSKTSSTPAFIAAVDPVVVVYTPGYRNRFGHPRPEVLARYEDAGALGYRTDYDGALSFDFVRGQSLLPRTAREEAARYWYDRPQPQPKPQASEVSEVTVARTTRATGRAH